MAETVKKPQLVENLEQVEAAIAKLRQASQQYAALKQHFLQLAGNSVPDGMVLRLAVPGPAGHIEIPLPVDPTAVSAYLENAMATLGGEITDIWLQIHAITTVAAGHCEEARKRAAEQPSGA